MQSFLEILTREKRILGEVVHKNTFHCDELALMSHLKKKMQQYVIFICDNLVIINCASLLLQFAIDALSDYKW